MREITLDELQRLELERKSEMIAHYGFAIDPPCRVVSTRADGAFEFALRMAKAGYKINLSGVNGQLWTVVVNEGDRV